MHHPHMNQSKSVPLAQSQCTSPIMKIFPKGLQTTCFWKMYQQCACFGTLLVHFWYIFGTLFVQKCTKSVPSIVSPRVNYSKACKSDIHFGTSHTFALELSCKCAYCSFEVIFSTIVFLSHSFPITSFFSPKDVSVRCVMLLKDVSQINVQAG